MDIRSLKYFERIAMTKSFSKAADSLYVSQPGLSKSIKKLEDELGIELFDRNSKHLMLTEEGRIFLERVRPLLEEYDNILETVHDTKELKKGKVSIGIPPIAGPLFFAPILARFKKAYSGIELSLHEYGSSRISDMVVAGELDLGICVEPFPEDLLSSISLFKDESVICFNSSNTLATKPSLALKDIVNEPFLMLSGDFSLNKQVLKMCADAGYVPKIAFSSSQWDFLLKMVSYMQGVTFLPGPMVYTLKWDNLVHRSFEPSLPWEIFVVVKRNRYQTYATQALMNTILESFHV